MIAVHVHLVDSRTVEDPFATNLVLKPMTSKFSTSSWVDLRMRLEICNDNNLRALSQVYLTF